MKRPAQHLIEEESRVNFAQLIPFDWVKNDFLKDYGKDIHLEIFRNNRATGNTFVVQLKGDSGKVINNKTSRKLKIKDLAYFAKYDRPVLLVYYNTNTKQFWAIWANRLLELIKLRENQKTVVITLDAANLIDRQFFLQLQDNFSGNIPCRINLIIRNNGGLAALLANRIKAWCKFYFPAWVEMDNQAIPHKLYMDISESAEALIIEAKNNTGQITIAPISTNNDLSFLMHPYLEEDATIAEPELEYLYILSCLFIDFDPAQSFRLLKGILHRYNGYHKTAETMLAFANKALDVNLVNELQVLIDSALEYKNYNDFQCLNMPLLNRALLRSRYRENLTRACEEVMLPQLKAVFCYNLGNSYRHEANMLLALRYYRQAGKLNQEYLSRYYWWHELAGVLFIAGRYKMAEKFYKKSIELDVDRKNIPMTFALTADACFQQAKFTEAASYFELYLNGAADRGKMPAGYYAFKLLFCEQMVTAGHESAILNNRESMALYKSGVAQNDEKQLLAAIDKHPLNFHAWHYLGLWAERDQQYETAYNCFLAAALITENDRDHWISCFIASMNLEQQELGIAILSIMVMSFGKTIVNDVSAALFNAWSADLETKKEVIHYYTKVADVIASSSEGKFYQSPVIEYRTNL